MSGNPVLVLLFDTKIVAVVVATGVGGCGCEGDVLLRSSVVIIPFIRDCLLILLPKTALLLLLLLTSFSKFVLLLLPVTETLLLLLMFAAATAIFKYLR